MNWKDILKSFSQREQVNRFKSDDDEFDDMAETPFPSHYFPNKVEINGKKWFFLTKLGDQGVYTDKRVKKDKFGPIESISNLERITLNVKEAEEAKI